MAPGPFASDTVFMRACQGEFDLGIAMTQRPRHGV
jgi:hypothetical protein